jgi:hypothetical protein
LFITCRPYQISGAESNARSYYQNKQGDDDETWFHVGLPPYGKGEQAFIAVKKV